MASRTHSPDVPELLLLDSDEELGDALVTGDFLFDAADERLDDFGDSGFEDALDASQEVWDLLSGGDVEWEADDDTDNNDLLAPSDEVARVSRRIAGQYVEVVASFAAAAFAGRANRASADQVAAAIDALGRLATAAGDAAQADLLAELRGVVQASTEGPRRGRARQRALTQLGRWIPRFARHLERDDAERLLRTVRWSEGAAPLMEELAAIKGIGPRRLQRLYAAGLYTVEVVAKASPGEIAEVTGMPVALAEKVVEQTVAYAQSERRRCLEGLRERARRLRSILLTTPLEGDGDLSDLVDEAMREVEATFRHLSGGKP